MLQLTELLSPEAIQAARQKFEGDVHQRRKMLCSFDELCRFFESSADFGSIARVSGVTRQAIGHTMRSLFGEEAVRRRTDARREEAAKARMERAQVERLSSEPLAFVADRAWSAGCEVSTVVCHHENAPDTVAFRHLLINGHFCNVQQVVRRFWPDKKNAVGYTVVPAGISRRTVEEVDAVLICTSVEREPRRVYVIPTAVLRATHFRPGAFQPREYKTLYIPLRKRPEWSKQNSPRIDFWEYEDAWHLLPKKETSPAPS